ncbi:MAG TPA: TetR/AcrR family transcriptional regulator [Burkholderiales bacterium]|nr:TetR/AcrR family transcriptional regulator [Burkholderiales bacterium]
MPPKSKNTIEDAPSDWTDLRYRRQVRDLKRRAVMNVAAQLFSERGFAATSLDDIARRVRMSKPTLYYYFENKEQILYECVQSGLKSTDQVVGELMESESSGLDILVAIMYKYSEVTLDPFSRFLVTVGEAHLPELTRKRLRSMRKKTELKLREVVRRAMDEGSIRRGDPKIVTSNFAGALSMMGRWYRPEGALGPRDIARQSIDWLLRGMLADAGGEAASAGAPQKAARKKAGRPA